MESRAKSRSGEAIAILVAMLLFVPWPFDLIAALSLESPALMGVVALMAPYLAVVVLPQVALAAFVFDRAARALAGLVRHSTHPRMNLAVALAFVFAVSWLPLFGGGENILGGVKLRNLYAQLMIDMGHVDPSMIEAIKAQPAPPRNTRTVNGVEVLGGPPVVIAPGDAAMPIAPRRIELTPRQVDCLKAGGTAQECAAAPKP